MATRLARLIDRALRTRRSVWPSAATPVLPDAALRVTDDGGHLLADVAVAERSDYLVSVPLLSATVVVDLYPHYLLFAGSGGETAYCGQDHACRTYVKFGACMQDKRVLFIQIHPVGQGRASRNPWQAF